MINPTHRQAVNFLKNALILVTLLPLLCFQSSTKLLVLLVTKLPISKVVTNRSPGWLWKWLWTKAGLDWSETQWWLEPNLQLVCRYVHWVEILVSWMYYELIKSVLKLGEQDYPKQTLTLTLGITLNPAVTLVYVFVNLRRTPDVPCAGHTSVDVTLKRSRNSHAWWHHFLLRMEEEEYCQKSETGRISRVY